VARFFRLWQKKRGERRTGSRLAGTVGEAAFFGALFVLGAVALAAYWTSQAIAPHPDFFTIGWGTWLATFVLASFILIGGAGLFFTVLEVGASAERRSALARRAGDIELIRESRSRFRRFPTIPRDVNLTNSPGVRLAYRLPGLESPAWRLVAAAVTALLCVGIDTVLGAVAIRAFHIGKPEMALNAFLVPFSSVTAWSVYYFTRQLLLHTWIGPTSVEISDHPLYPGRAYEVVLVQGGHLKVNHLRLALVCEEEVTYRQGTDLRTERRTAHEGDVFERGGFTIDPSAPFEHCERFAVPRAAMHSFQSAHNAITWKLVVTLDLHRWPRVVRGFPVVVYPLIEGAERGSAD